MSASMRIRSSSGFAAVRKKTVEKNGAVEVKQDFLSDKTNLSNAEGIAIGATQNGESKKLMYQKEVAINRMQLRAQSAPVNSSRSSQQTSYKHDQFERGSIAELVLIRTVEKQKREIKETKAAKLKEKFKKEKIFALYPEKDLSELTDSEKKSLCDIRVNALVLCERITIFHALALNTESNPYFNEFARDEPYNAAIDLIKQEIQKNGGADRI